MQYLLEMSLHKQNIRCATRLSTTGGFYAQETITSFIIGIEEERVQEALDIISKTVTTHEQMTVPPAHTTSMRSIAHQLQFQFALVELATVLPRIIYVSKMEKMQEAFIRAIDNGQAEPCVLFEGGKRN